MKDSFFIKSFIKSYHFSVSSSDFFIKRVWGDRTEYADTRRISSARLTPGITRYRKKNLFLINHGQGLKQSVNTSDDGSALATTAPTGKLFLSKTTLPGHPSNLQEKRKTRVHGPNTTQSELMMGSVRSARNRGGGVVRGGAGFELRVFILH